MDTINGELSFVQGVNHVQARSATSSSGPAQQSSSHSWREIKPSNRQAIQAPVKGGDDTSIGYGENDSNNTVVDRRSLNKRSGPPRHQLITQDQIEAILSQSYNCVNQELRQTGYDFDLPQISSALKHLLEDFGKVYKIDWCPILEQIVQMGKNCLVFRTTFKNQIVRYKTIRRIGGANCQDLYKHFREIIINAFEMLEAILSLLSPKNSFKFFMCLMSTTTECKYGLLDFFESEDLLLNFRTAVRSVNLSKLLSLLMSSMRKAKCVLSLGERKFLTCENVPFTSFTTSFVRYLDRLCIFLLKTIETAIPDLSIEEVYEALANTVVDYAPFLSRSLDPDVQRKLIHLLSSPGELCASGIPKYRVLSLMALLIHVEWNSDGLVPNMTRRDFYMLTIDYCIETLTQFLQDVDHKVIEIQDACPVIKSVQSCICVFTSCAEKSFEQFRPDAMRCLILISKILDVEPKFYKLWYCRSTVTSTIPTRSVERQNKVACVQLVVHCLVFIQVLSREFGTFVEEEKYGENDLNEETERFLEVWYKEVSNPRRFQTTDVEVLSALVDCLSSLKEVTFQQLNDNQKLFCMVNILTFARHHTDNVRDRAARGMAFFLEFRTIVEDDMQFMLDCLDAIEYQITSTGSSNSTGVGSPKLLHSRLVASWAASNLCDALAKYHRQTVHPCLGWNTYKKLYELGMKLQNDHHKMKYNANRALGALILWTPAQFLDNPLLETYVKTIVSVLEGQLGTGGDFKARWNAAYALGNVIKKTEIWSKFHNDLSGIIFPAIIRALKIGDNFKERIHCMKALQAIYTSAGYDNYFKRILVAVLEAFNATEESKVMLQNGVFCSFKDEVSRTVMHLAAMVDVTKDYFSFESIFTNNYETLVEGRALMLKSNNEEDSKEWIQLGLRNVETIINKINN